MDAQYVAKDIDPKDVGTPDEWVPRDPRLIRLTGKHPFNCEPPLDLCYDQGFITPPAIHYVRNHGHAPQIKWEDHRLTIDGLVDTPTTFTMDQLVNDFTDIVTTLPVTLVCAGNRRKEQNMTKKTIGFSWGPCAHATSNWTGIRLCDMLQRLGVDRSKARHVCMVGFEELPNGRYGTSIPMSLAMDPSNDVLISWQMNGIHLTPDHGYPLRIIIPGWIGGRMIKWVTNITVTEEPSDNYYHFFDNRIMPPHVDAELAKAEGWWYKPEYLFNQLNINSAVAHPWHDAFVGADEEAYLIRGYAYSGGGAKVTRVEISFDNCQTWQLCDCRWPEEERSYAPKLHDKYWCWMFWEYKVDMVNMLQVPEFQIRAWDATNNTQPEKLTWNLMGMGNNPVFRVKCHPERREGKLGIRFEHPTRAGPTKGGWMDRVVPEAAPVAEAPKEKAEELKSISWQEVSKHTTEDSVWFVVDKKVYDATSYLKDHPGGAQSIVMNGGMDASEDFNAIHSTAAKAMLKDYLIGAVTGDEVSRTDTEVQANVALNPTKWIPFELIEKEYLSRDVVRLRFALQSPQHRFGLPVGYHAFMRCKVDGETVVRAYTPTSSDDDLGFFELVIKIYFAKENPRFPDGGKMSQWFHRLELGQSLEVKGPMGHFEYKGMGKCELHGKEYTLKKIGLMAGGTGITPCLQVLKAIAKNPEDKTEAHLLFANKTPDDVICRDMLDELAKHSNIHVWYTVDSAPEGWQYSTGFISPEMIKERLFGPGENCLVGMCGPPPMYKFACIPGLEKLGFNEADYFQF
jgi:nitrate reductase (NAD(P)H)